MNQKSLDKQKPKELEWSKWDNKKQYFEFKSIEDRDMCFSWISSLLQKQRKELWKKEFKIRGILVKSIKQQILNLECLKEEKITKNIFSITQLESRNKLRNQIKDEIKKL